MKCNRGTDLVCTCYERCNKAKICLNVPNGIRDKLYAKEGNRELIVQSKKRIKKSHGNS